MLMSCSFTVVAQKTTPLRFRDDGTFKIVQFTDLHYIHGDKRAQRALECIRTIAQVERPDLIVVTGDIIFDRPAAPCMNDVARCLDSIGIPYCTVFGNHDAEYDLDHDALHRLLQTPNNIEPPHTEGEEYDYVLRVMGSRDDSTRAVFYFLDSHSHRWFGLIHGYAWLKKKQIKWYRALSDTFSRENGGEPVPSLMFFHIPIPEFAKAARKQRIPLVGSRCEPACVPPYNSGMFKAVKRQGDVMGIFCGHDHNNDYAVLWKDILLAYGRYSGGNTVYNDLPGNGARVILIRERERKIETYIRLRDGSVYNQLTVPDNMVKSDYKERDTE